MPNKQGPAAPLTELLSVSGSVERSRQVLQRENYGTALQFIKMMVSGLKFWFSQLPHNTYQ